MSGQPTGKICVICGEDCAGRPRTKDANGHYYHQDCYDAARRARAAHEAREATEAAAVSSVPATPDEEPDPFGLLNEVIDESAASASGPGFALGANSGSAAGGPAAGHMCPSCAMTLAPGSVICTNCGFNIQTGHAVGSTAMAAPAVSGGVWAGGSAGGGTVWPVVIGIISIIFGSCSALLYGFSLVSSLGGLTGQPMSYKLGAITAPVLTMLLALWLLLAGIGVLRRRQEAAVQIRRWAIVKTVFYGLCFGCLSVLVVASGDALEQFQTRVGGELESDFTNIGVSMILAGLAVVFAWVLFWPIFILIWFGRAKIQAQIGTW